MYRMDIRLVIFDFDGVFSDGTFSFSASGELQKGYNAKDAYALTLLMDAGVHRGIITTDTSVDLINAKHIYPRLDFCKTGVACKLQAFHEIMKEFPGLSPENVAYIGDDLPDIPVIEAVGISACPSDAVPEVLTLVNYQCARPGGHGAVREFVSMLLNNCIIK